MGQSLEELLSMVPDAKRGTAKYLRVAATLCRYWDWQHGLPEASPGARERLDALVSSEGLAP